MTVRFGFEAEFESNVDLLIARLSEQGHARQDSMHSYHCDCYDACEFGEGRPLFRAQRDSSCGGEVISNILSAGDWDTARLAFEALQEAAVEVDAEPSWHAGMHVHVGVREYATGAKEVAMFWNILRFEDVITEQVAPGRFPRQRDMNSSIGDELWCIDGFYDGDRDDSWVELPEACNWDERLAALDTDAHRKAFKRLLYLGHLDADRHSNLNLRPGRHTWEFRFFNSTRSAWRMELFVRTALLFTDLDAIETLAEVPATIVGLTDAAREHDPRLHELLRRQAEYRPVGRNQPFTLLVAA